eukprot:TRINITY_DN28009_c0_g1_i1.p1 TRINITY_DN28009_c0_g1~~TRINITY_DN28009_c0_g1_i1.p1  ORF type:complete len:551 (+),score=173.80 TRINITY_DN28009_c0_g1_i1:217-1653(+)
MEAHVEHRGVQEREEVPFAGAQEKFNSVRMSRVLLVTWFAYAAYIIARKPFSIVRVEVLKEIDMSTFMSGMVDTSFLFTYCFGQIFYSQLKSHYSSKFIISLGLFGAAGCTLLFAMTSSPHVMVFLWGLNGVFESFGWPSCVSVVTPWLAAKERGRIMGIWGSCQAVGSLLANWVVASLLVWGWRTSYMGVVLIVGGLGLVVLLSLLEHPNRAGMVSPAQWADGMRPADLKAQHDVTVDGEVTWTKDPIGVVSHGGPQVTEPDHQHLTTAQLARMPSVLDLAASYFCQKLVRYSLTSWLPYYLTKELGYGPILAGYVASSFDFGGIVGSIASGVFSDWYAGGRRRVGACGIYLQCGTVSLLLFSVFKPLMLNSMFVTCLISGAVGFFFFGCDTLMTGATMQDLSERLKVPQHAGSISGFVGGIGSIGAILQGPVTALLADNYGWQSVFYFLIVLSAAAFLCMVRPIMLERRSDTSLQD